jgi:hypothetical protein
MLPDLAVIAAMEIIGRFLEPRSASYAVFRLR